jgi:EPS-associated MarR family transcriptional regulator
VLLTPKSVLTDESRYRILKLLKENPDMSQRQIAEALGVSLGKVNYCLRAMVEKGLIKVGNFRRRANKLDYVYLLTPKGLREKARVTLRFLQQKQDEHEVLLGQLEELRREVAELRLVEEKE